MASSSTHMTDMRMSVIAELAGHLQTWRPESESLLVRLYTSLGGAELQLCVEALNRAVGDHEPGVYINWSDFEKQEHHDLAHCRLIIAKAIQWLATLGASYEPMPVSGWPLPQLD